MARNGSRTLVIVASVGFGAAIILAVIAGSRAAPDRRLFDPRRSTLLTGPEGTSALAAALEALHVPVERRRRPLFGLAVDTVEVTPGSWLALLDFKTVAFDERRGVVRTGAFPPSAVEIREVVRYVEQGGWAFLAGRTGVERCFGLQITAVHDPWDEEEPPAVVAPPDFGPLPGAHAVLEPADTAGATRRERRLRVLGREACEASGVAARRDLLATDDGLPVALGLELAGGGRVILLADARYVSNQTLKESDAGALVLSWLLEERPARVIVDEYHQGFGRGGSIWAAAWAWTRRSPGGWAMLQLAVAGLVALGAAAVRFGPALRVVQRRRRSPMEHLDALAVGLERAEGATVSIRLITEGLKRRLSRAGAPRRRGGNLEAWLDSLARATEDPEARAAVTRLRTLVREPGGHPQVLEAALAVEDVWQALRPTNRPRRS